VSDAVNPRRISVAMGFKLRALGAVLIVYTMPAWGWDDQGHMMVAAVAWDHLGDASRARVTALLKLNPDYATWIVDTTPQERDKIAFMRAANWPDAIKSEAGYQNDGNWPENPDAARNIGYADHLQHRYWHFIDLPLSAGGAAVLPPATPNVQTQIHAFTAAIGSHDVNDDIKSYDLVWLEHLVGDAHQPLHATSRFSAGLPRGDQGGNLVALCARPCRDELHFYWDDILGTSRTPAAALSEAARLPAPSPAVAAIADESVWIRESFDAARRCAYAAPIGDGSGPYSLDAHYREAALAEARERASLAGVRLANLINSTIV
jgi:S1/P1 Nuclease